MSSKSNSSTIQGELLYGAHSIIEMLKAKRRKLISLYTTKPLPKAWERITPYLPKYVPNIQYVSRDVLDRMAGIPDHNGIVAWVTPFKFATTLFTPKEKPFILVLDSLQDVRNVGAILRSAYCIGIDGIVMCKSKAALMSPATHRASSGLAEHLSIYQAASLRQAVAELKQSGYNLYMATLNGTNATEVTYQSPMAVVIGNEATGITSEIKKFGTAVTLPQRSVDLSYNASVAAGILMFLIAQQKK